ncbi:MAG TPA: NAD(P)/FAD-dependent oxidoreductase [Blastocatellia bacterium]|nr:NAD(P)/FAD-dependent oxidoreductase [Blastocatellia bacterium]
MPNSFDAIIIGGGHNGLVTACYLARAGKKVIVLERRQVLGGACVTEEVWPGFKVSTLSYLCSLFQPRIIEELELKRFGYHIYPKDPSFFTAFPDGRHIFFFGEQRKTLEQIAKFSKRDAEYFPHYERELEQLAEWVESLLLTTPPNLINRKFDDLMKFGSLGLKTMRLGDAGLKRLVKIQTQSVRDFLDERFESEEIKTTLATDGVIGANGGPSTPGTAYILLHHVMGGAAGVRGLWGFIRGGMGAISQALADSAQSRGAVIRTNAEVRNILVRNGRAVGVALADGEEVRARVVVSNADPKRTFLGLVDRRDLDEEFRREVENIRCAGASVKINLALDGLPNFKAFPTAKLDLPHKTTMHVCPSMDYIDRAWDDAAQGRPATNPMLECTIPTAYDDSIAPPGKHIMCIFAQFAPYRLNDAQWDDQLKNQFADRCLDALSEYAPNIREIILHRQVISPLDLEREYGLTGGSIFHGDMTLDQLFFMRPLAGWAKYRTPIRNLYLCGSGTHPGGGVMGAPGYNAAREILADWKGVWMTNRDDL